MSDFIDEMLQMLHDSVLLSGQWVYIARTRIACESNPCARGLRQQTARLAVYKSRVRFYHELILPRIENGAARLRTRVVRIWHTHRAFHRPGVRSLGRIDWITHNSICDPARVD